MSQSRLLLNLLFTTCSLAAVACAIPADDGAENADSQDNDLKKKVQPKGGNGAFDLVAPAFNATGFLGNFFFDSAPIKAGERSEKVPGAYVLQGQSQPFADGTLMRQALTMNLTAGAVTKHQLGGLRVRFAEPVTLGSSRVDITPETGSTGYLAEGRTWQSAPNGVSMLALAGKINVTSAADAVQTVAVVTEGALKEIVLPTSRLSVLVDAYDPAYPTTPGCASAQTLVRAGATGSPQYSPVRLPDGSPIATLVVPQGTRAPVVLMAYGLEVSEPTLSGQTHTFRLNRLEIDDVEVALAGGGKSLVKGTVTVAYKRPDGTFSNLNCTFPTHSGMDLPDGTYTVTSRAQAPSGLITSTETVSFP